MFYLPLWVSGTDFLKNLEFAEFENPKIRLEDGSRLIGKKLKRNGEIDIISKGVYTPCNSRIKIGNFICPTWQLEGEKILHDNDNLFLYQKHSKMRVLNTPVFYIPYLVMLNLFQHLENNIADPETVFRMTIKNYYNFYFK